MSTKPSLLSLCLMGGLGSISAFAQAQTNTAESAEVFRLPNVVVTTTEPATQKTISRDDIQLKQANSIADVLSNEPSISVGGGARNAQRFYLRGIDSGNLNVTIDGATQGRSLHQHRGNIGSIDPQLLKRVTIQPGPRADAGPGALGGSVRFETVDAQDLLKGDRKAGFIAKTGYATADKAKQGGLTLYGLVADRIGLLAHIGAVNREDYREGGGQRTPNSAGQDRDYMVKLSLIEQYGHSLRIGASRSQNTGLYLFGSIGSDMG
ncbi:Heme transporter BhuA [Oligella urethralis]|uniref:TonB-dependent receptor plug domain-containing protein n=1 Tax=Oligella urethralis TaxID=90245 RepID=UPI00295894C5|nr:TonB-dependent receptor plug domain-containing protein [Oligella urethralis]WOS38703.1 Heme transporter BhuA [Oligella urethralis]